MNFLKKALDFFLYSNIFISVCAAAMAGETYLLIHSGINWHYIAFVFASTMALYNFPVLVEDNFSPEQSGRHTWVSENKKLLIILFVIASAATGILVFFFPFKFILWFIPVAVLAFAYFFPQTHLRSITGLKAAIVAFVWTMLTYVYPFLLTPLSFGESWSGAFERFLFMLPLCVIFNVRDMGADRSAGVRTIPVVYGMKPTIIICLVSLLLFSALVIFNRGFSAEAVALTVSAIVSGILILKSSPDKDDYFYSFGIDGMIILQAGVIILQNFF